MTITSGTTPTLKYEWGGESGMMIVMNRNVELDSWLSEGHLLEYVRLDDRRLVSTAYCRLDSDGTLYGYLRKVKELRCFTLRPLVPVPVPVGHTTKARTVE